MSKFKTHGALALLAALALSGCTSKFYDYRMQGFSPEMPSDVYPIDVVKGAVKLKLPARAGHLTAQEEDAVRRLAIQAVSHPSPVVVSRPAGSLTAEVTAAKVTRLLTDAGIEPDRIRHVTHAGGGPLVVSYRRKFAVTKECGDWSKPVTETAKNRPPANFGCAQQNNIAAMVDNPEDFERPRVMTPPDADNRVNAVVKYRKREDYNSAKSSQSEAKVSDTKSGG